MEIHDAAAFYLPAPYICLWLLYTGIIMYGYGISALVIAILIAAQNRVILIILLQIILNTIMYFKGIWLI